MHPLKLPHWWPALEALFTNERKALMAALDDLNAAVTAIQTAVAAAIADLQALETEVQNLKTSGVDPTAVEAVASQINTLATNLQAAVTAAPV